MTTTNTDIKETDYLIIGAGAMGIAFADVIFNKKTNLKITIVDRRAKPGGHWINSYPFVRLHQPAAFYGVNSMVLGDGGGGLSSKSEILEYYKKIMDKFVGSGRVEFLSEHNYLGNGQVAHLQSPDKITSYKINKSLVDATYMKVEVPFTHPPKFVVDDGVPFGPINDLSEQYDKWKKFYIIGSGKTGIDAIIFLIEKGVPSDNINWICPNQSWFFNRNYIQEGQVSGEILNHAQNIIKSECADDTFREMEKSGGIVRIDETTLPVKWRCAIVSPEELANLKGIKNVIKKGRINRITRNEIELEQGTVPYSGKALFIDCSANGLARLKQAPIFSEGKIVLQPVLFCQQVFSAAAIGRFALINISDKRKNKVVPIPHPEFKEDWPSAMAMSIKNLLILHLYIPMWLFHARLNFMSHEPLYKYCFYSAKALLLSFSLSKAAKRIDSN